MRFKISSDPMKVALHFLKFRPRTNFEIEQKLKLKRISDKKIKRVIAVLEKNKLLDDLNFAKMWVKDRNNFKPSGSYLLKLELKKLGVVQDIIDQVLIGQNEEELAKKALSSKSRLKQVSFQKKAQFLQRRGFKTAVIYKVIKND